MNFSPCCVERLEPYKQKKTKVVYYECAKCGTIYTRKNNAGCRYLLICEAPHNCDCAINECFGNRCMHLTRIKQKDSAQ